MRHKDPFYSVPFVPFGVSVVQATFTGQEYDEETDIQYFINRYYDNELGRFLSMDPWDGELTNPQSFNKYSYVFNNPIIYVDPTGESGELTINTKEGGFTGGHAWVSFTSDDTQEMVTYGTWGNNPDNQGNGLLKNIELNRGMEADISRALHINDSQEESLFGVINNYTEAGDSGWKLLAPCSAFAQDAWEAGTGEYLNANTFIVNNPQKLGNSIIDANGGQDHNVINFSDNNSFSSFGNSSINTSFNGSFKNISTKVTSFFSRIKNRFDGVTSRNNGEFSNSSIQPIFVRQ